MPQVVYGRHGRRLPSNNRSNFRGENMEASEAGRQISGTVVCNIPEDTTGVSVGNSLRTPQETIANATEIANVLSQVVEQQKLYAIISGKKYVKVDAWICLGTLMGLTPREVKVTELKDGSFEAEVEIVRMNDGFIMGRASSICGKDEKRWGGADKYARRSMSVTRATGKAFRLSFSWIMCMAGYEATPEEEMPTETFEQRKTLKKKLEVYTEADNQKIRFKDLALTLGCPDDKDAFIELSKECNNVEFSKLPEAITKYLLECGFIKE